MKFVCKICSAFLSGVCNFYKLLKVLFQGTIETIDLSKGNIVTVLNGIYFANITGFISFISLKDFDNRQR